MSSRRLLVFFLAFVLVAACTTTGASSSPGRSGSTASASPTAIGPDIRPTPIQTDSAPPSEPATPSASSSPTATPRPTPAPTPSPTPASTTVVRAYYFLQDPSGGVALVPVLRTVPGTAAIAKAAMTALLAGPRDAERRERISSGIPHGAKLLGIHIGQGVATVNLSREFYVHDGGARVWGRLAQVTYTLTQFSTVNHVAFEREGTSNPVFRGPDAIRLSENPEPMFDQQGLILDTSLARSQFRRSTLPSIFVDRPAWGAALPSPGRVTGLTNVPEAQFRMALLDRNHRVLVETPVTASCGTGCWGTFDVTLRYTVAEPQWGTLRVWDISEANGRPVGVREYPIYVGPGR